MFLQALEITKMFTWINYLCPWSFKKCLNVKHYVILETHKHIKIIKYVHFIPCFMIIYFINITFNRSKIHTWSKSSVNFFYFIFFSFFWREESVVSERREECCLLNKGALLKTEWKTDYLAPYVHPVCLLWLRALMNKYSSK